MSAHDETTLIDEVKQLRRVALKAGLPGFVTPESLGIELDGPDEFLAKMKRLEQPEPRAPHRRFRMVAIAAAAVAATAAVVLGVVPLLPKSAAEANTPPILSFEFASAKSIAYAPGKDATAELRLLSRVAGKASAPPGSGTTQHVVTDNWFESIESNKGKISTVLVPTINETSLKPDGSFRNIERTGKPLSPDGRGLPKHGAWDKQPKSGDETQPAGTLDAQFADNLPPDRGQLMAAMLKAEACESTSRDTIRTNCLFHQINALYTTYVVSPQLSSHIWEMLSTEAGVRLLGRVEDRARRSGIGVSLIPKDEPETRYILIISPTTGQLLGSENILIKTTPKNDVKAPAIATFTAILDSRHTNG